MLAEHEMNYIIDHEVLLITTAEKAKDHVVTKVYPVADLVLPIAINSMLNPFQTGGGLGGQSGFNSGQSGGLGQGGFGQGFGGGGGGGGFGGGGFGGGGAFDVPDPIPAKARPANAGHVSSAVAPATQAVKPMSNAGATNAAATNAAATNAAATNAAATRVAASQPRGAAVAAKGAVIDVKVASKAGMDAAWDRYFAGLPTPDRAHAAAVTRQRNESVRETVRQLMNAQKYAEVAALIRGACQRLWSALDVRSARIGDASR